METGYGAITSVVIDNEGVGNEIPGLALSTEDDALPEDAAVSPRALTELEDANLTDLNNANQDTFTNLVGSAQDICPVICLADEQKDQLQQLAFVRIVDAYKQVTVAGGSQVRFSILAHSGMEFPLELDPWKLLKTHILSDYVNHEVANKLYPLSSISKKIEDFAKEMLLSVVGDNQIELEKEADGIHAELQKDENPSSEKQPVSLAVKEISVGSHQNSASESIPSSMIAEVQRCMSLYFALCTKKNSLFRQIFDVYKGTSKAAKQAVHRQIPLLVRTIGSSRELLDILSDPPTGSEGLVTQVLLIFPHLVNSPLDKFQVALSRVLQGLNHSPPVLTPAEALIAIHGIDPDRDGIPLKKVEQIPLPLLFMRTVLQAIGAFPSLLPSAQLENALNRTSALKAPLVAHASQPQ
ncbi:UNVERIFIED_CONTAM: Symplekin [Sesamum radiatum]|uniref:Symplekin n=1 Tax=Sesamum radiatum TaxID=300843 RepID=A0AAW2R5T9_SESRA